MLEENDPDLYTLQDEDGKETTFELLDKFEEDGTMYYAMFPVEDDSDDDDLGFVILKGIINDNVDDEFFSEEFVSLDDEDELDRIGKIFIERLQNSEDEEDDEQ